MLRYLGDSKLFFVEPYEGAKELCDEIYDLGGVNQIITARGTEDNPNIYYNNALKKTEKWLNQCGLKYNRIIFSENKVSHMYRLQEEFGVKFSVVIDDDLKSIVSILLKYGHIKGIVPEKTYNKVKEGVQKKLEKEGRLIIVKNLIEAKNILKAVVKDSG